MSTRWRAKLLPDITRWMERNFGEINYYLTKVLSGHSFLGKMTRPNCVYGDASIDDTKYTFFHCERLRLERTNLKAKVGACTIGNFCDVIPRSEES